MEENLFDIFRNFSLYGVALLDSQSLIENQAKIDQFAKGLIQRQNGQKATFGESEVTKFFELLLILETNKGDKTSLEFLHDLLSKMKNAGLLK